MIPSGFRPHQGIILFNKSSGSNALYSSAIYLVSVPIRGLFYLTEDDKRLKALSKNGFRPHQGIILFNFSTAYNLIKRDLNRCFRPHQGIILFNTLKTLKFFLNFIIAGFRPHQGIILFNTTKTNIVNIQEAFKKFPSPSGDYFI